MFALAPMPHTEACKFIADKPVVSRQIFDELLPEFRAKAFVITGVEDFDLVQTIKDQIATLPAGGDYDKLVGDIEEKLAPWLGGAAPRRAELLVRWHGFQAYATAQHQAILRQADIFPYCMYVSSEDSRVRPGHAALDRIVAPTGSLFWDRHTPPWEPQCRCDKIPLTHEDVDQMKEEDKHLTKSRQRVQDGPHLAALEQSNIVHGEIATINGQRIFLRGPGQDKHRGTPASESVDVKAKGMSWNPNDVTLTPEMILGRYDPEVGDAFKAWASTTKVDGRGTSAWDWMNGAKAHSSRPPSWPTGKMKSAKRRGARVGIEPPESGASGMREIIRNAKFSKTVEWTGSINHAVKLSNGVTVLFKAKDGEHGSQIVSGVKVRTQYLREKAASVLDEEMKLNLVPPTEIIKHRGDEGSAQLWREGKSPAFMSASERDAALKMMPSSVRHDWQLLDDLLLSQDRHDNNYYFVTRKGGPTDVVCIDNGLSLPTNDGGFQGRKAFNAAGLDGHSIPARQLERLDDLLAREAEVSARLVTLVPQEAVDGLFARARALRQSGIYGSSAASLGNTPAHEI